MTLGIPRYRFLSNGQVTAFCSFIPTEEVKHSLGFLDGLLTEKEYPHLDYRWLPMIC